MSTAIADSSLTLDRHVIKQGDSGLEAGRAGK